ncbi:MAG: Gfo/Idh/MocA family oxidoreductase [Bryobacteraceae bacterium]
MGISRRQVLQSGAALAASRLPLIGANEKIQVGFIGCGARSHELMKALMQVPGTTITGLVDAYKGRLERAQERVGRTARILPSYSDMLSDKSFDAVVVVTPDHWHKKMVVDAVNAGKDVYCEKPLTFRTSDGPEIIAAVKSTGRIVQVGSQGVSSDTAAKAREWIKSGKLGKVTMIRAAYNRNTASGAWIYPIPPDASPTTVNWDMFLGPAPKRPYSNERFFRWRCYKDYSGGIATDLFVHLATTIHYLMDAKVPSRVLGMGQLYRWKESREVPDTLNAVLEYPEGFTVNLSSTFNNQTSAEGGFQFNGTEGTLTLGNGVTFYPERAREDNRWIVESWPKRLEEAYYKDPKVRQVELGEGMPKRDLEPQTFKGTGDNNVQHLANWIDSIRTRKPHWEDVSAGHHAAACAHMVNQSAESGRAVQWDFERDDVRQS